MNEFVTYKECEIHRGHGKQDLENVASIARDNRSDITRIDKDSVEQSVVLKHLVSSVKSLDKTMQGYITILNSNNIDTAKNSQSVEFNKSTLYRIIGIVIAIVGWGIAIFK